MRRLHLPVIFLLLMTASSSFSQQNRFTPEIKGQTPSPLVTKEGSSITITLGNLIVTDKDPTPVYPNGFSLEVNGGKNYKVQGATVTPDKNFSGMLKVPVEVSDGKNKSKKFDLQINVQELQNAAPQITGQSPVSMNQGASLTIVLNHLKVTDPDNTYPTGFTLKVFSDNNFTINGNTITPSASFSGKLTVPVSVNDGLNESNQFDLKIDVVKAQNTPPKITAQQPLNVNQGGNLKIEFAHLTVIDPDNTYPTGFTLKVFDGNNYTANGNTITPSANFSGKLTVPVSVNDGQNESNRFDLKIDVVKTQNTPPQITGQSPVSMNQGASLTIVLNHLKVTDPDNTYPTGFTLKVFDGNNFTANGNIITPSGNFSGMLTVPVSVNDGQNESNRFDLKIDVVKSQNVAPKITGQVPLNTNINTSILIKLSDLIVTDPDNKYPDDFTLTISRGNNYSVAGNIVTPRPGFTGMLEVAVVVNDKKANSPEFKVKINVLSVKPNVPPVITGQKSISITQNTSVTLQLSHLFVTDPDDTYPNDFTLKVFPGNDYSVDRATVAPRANISNGTFGVKVSVNDGENESAPFELKIQVTPLTSNPKINGQKELSVREDSTLVISLSDLIVTDADDPDYPQGFSLIILPGNADVYTTEGGSIKPALNLNGFIEVGVKVSDGINKSDEFKLSILVDPVNDSPEILSLETAELKYVPGAEPITIFESLDLRDVDSDHLIFAEIGFRHLNYNIANDELIFSGDASNIKAVYDSMGTLFLIGYATIAEYRSALRSIQYNYRLTQDENGNSSNILSGPRTIYINVDDGQLVSPTYERQINMETNISLEIPKAFTPNGDTWNDTWGVNVSNTDKVDDAIIRVYDKRGVLVYESRSFEKRWDGIFNGQVLPVDTYYYTVDLSLPYMKKMYKGAVTILH